MKTRAWFVTILVTAACGGGASTVQPEPTVEAGTPEPVDAGQEAAPLDGTPTPTPDGNAPLEAGQAPETGVPDAGPPDAAPAPDAAPGDAAPDQGAPDVCAPLAQGAACGAAQCGTAGDGCGGSYMCGAYGGACSTHYYACNTGSCETCSFIDWIAQPNSQYNGLAATTWYNECVAAYPDTAPAGQPSNGYPQPYACGPSSSTPGPINGCKPLGQGSAGQWVYCCQMANQN